MDGEEGQDEYYENNRLLAKIKKDPAVPIGLIGLTSVVVYGLYNFKNRKQRASLYLIHLRLAAQGTLMTCVTLGLIYQLGRDHLRKLFPEKKN